MSEVETQMMEPIRVESLAAEADALRLDGWRLVQILCVATADSFELSYSFGGGYAMRTLRVTIRAKTPVPSITPYYPAAFLYENEIRDLFGVRIERIDPDWNGKVYDVAGRKPFAKASLAMTSSEKPASPARAATPDAAGLPAAPNAPAAPAEGSAP